MYDMSGYPEFKSIRNNLYDMSDAVLVVFDVTSRQSFDDIDLWIREAYENIPKNCSVSVVGTKIDLKNRRVVTYNEAYSWC